MRSRSLRPALACISALLLFPAGAAARDEPVVVTGAEVPPLAGAAPGGVVAFAYDAERSDWTQVPVQVDERKFVDFGRVPATNSTPGSEGTVYGGTTIGHGALQYADPATWVGPDPDSLLDADDEIALMAGDAGDRAASAGLPAGVVAAGATELQLADPLGEPDRFVYLFEASGGLPQGAGRDYVDYDFRLASGDYRTTYKRRTGPNPETSRITTGAYEAGFSDRWFLDHLAIRAGGASGAEISDGFKFSFGPTSCGRSEATFNGATDNYGFTEQGEGAFVANLDGPVRAIRSYVGANSGPLTERTHAFYRDRYTIVTDLRVHAVPGPLTYHDLAAGGIGMTYLNSANRGGVAVDGNPDAISPAVAAWHLWTGAQGSLLSTDRTRSSFADALMAGASTWYLDDSTPAPNLQCWGDLQAYGQAGLRSTTGMPNTDPSIGGTDDLRSTTTDVVSGPGMTAERADRITAEIDAPLTVGARGFAPDTEAPRTRIAKRPDGRLETPRARYRFASNEPKSRFECRLDRKRWKRCGRKQVFRRLDAGGHRLRVRAVDPAGNADRTPAKDRFLVER